MPEEKLDVGEAEEEAVEVDVNPDAKQIKSETEPPKETEIIQEKLPRFIRSGTIKV